MAKRKKKFRLKPVKRKPIRPRKVVKLENLNPFLMQ
jgi:hypothetical protein